MAIKAQSHHRREESLSRDQIIAASIELLDSGGEDELTFRTLSERLATGPGAIYGYIANKNDLLTAACDALVARTVETCVTGPTPEAAIRALAMGMFDTIDEHPWVGSALMQAELYSPMVRLLERVGQQICALGVPEEDQWATASALTNYIFGVGAQNATNGQNARMQGLDRSAFLRAISDAWLQLDSKEYPFTHRVAGQLPAHDDRGDFLAGIDLILRGIASLQPRRRPQSLFTI